MGIWYEITSSAAGTALRIVLRTRLSVPRTSLGFEAIYSFTDLNFVFTVLSLGEAGRCAELFCKAKRFFSEHSCELARGDLPAHPGSLAGPQRRKIAGTILFRRCS